MRREILLLMLAMAILAGCGTREVRCDARLTPINAPAIPSSETRRALEAS